jgi:hypothetical protein
MFAGADVAIRALFSCPLLSGRFDLVDLDIPQSSQLQQPDNDQQLPSHTARRCKAGALLTQMLQKSFPLAEQWGSS